MLLGEAIAIFTKEADGKGMHCPCCGRWGKVNGFPITMKTRGRGVLWFRAKHIETGGAWIDTPKVAPLWLFKNLAPLQWWGLIEHMPKPDDPKQKSSGLWRITPLGLQFAAGEVKVREKVWVFDARVQKFTGPDRDIRECIGRFNYSAMMAQRFDEA